MGTTSGRGFSSPEASRPPHQRWALYDEKYIPSGKGVCEIPRDLSSVHGLPMINCAEYREVSGQLWAFLGPLVAGNSAECCDPAGCFRWAVCAWRLVCHWSSPKALCQCRGLFCVWDSAANRRADGAGFCFGLERPRPRQPARRGRGLVVASGGSCWCRLAAGADAPWTSRMRSSSSCADSRSAREVPTDWRQHLGL